jgi:hypothetical protein
MSEQIKRAKFEGKVTQLVALDQNLWTEFTKLRSPYGTVNELFEDCVRILLGMTPKHENLLQRFRLVIKEMENKV